ncbi:MAG: hypothetical protein ACP5HX_09870 [Thermoproteota archaeon]
MKKYLSYLKEDLRNNKEAGSIDLDFQRPIDEDWWSREHGPSIARSTSEATFDEIKKKMAEKIQLVAKIKEGK